MYFDEVSHKIDLSLSVAMQARRGFICRACGPRIPRCASWKPQPSLGRSTSKVARAIGADSLASQEAFLKYVEAVEELSAKATAGTPPSRNIGTNRFGLTFTLKALAL